MRYTKDEITATVNNMLEAAIDANKAEEKERVKALKYYDGEVPDLEEEDGRSTAVSKDVRAAMIKLMPSIMRTFFGSDIFAKFLPVRPEDDKTYKQATDYFNRVIMTETDVEKAIHAAVFDGLLLKTGILKTFIDERRDVRIARYTNLDDEQFMSLLDEDGVELVDHTEHEEMDQDVLAIIPDARRHDCKIRKTLSTDVPSIMCVAPEDFLMYPNFDTIASCPLVGDKSVVSRSDLVSAGYDRAQVDELEGYQTPETDEDDAREGEDQVVERTLSDLDNENEMVEVFELYVRLDLDDDGIAELYKITMGGGSADERSLLDIEEFDEAPYSDVTPELEAHQFKGHSLFEDTDDIQKIKTALLRNQLDNIYARNNQQVFFDPSAVADVKALYDREFGKPIKLKRGANAQQAVQFRETPYIGDAAQVMMSYLDGMAEQRTGVTDASAGLDPDALTNTTATVANMIDSKGVAQAEMKIRSMARGGIRDAYRKLLRLAIQHQDRPRQIRIKNEWVSYDPRTWNSEMDCVVNIGMGAGSRERDMQALMMILAQQKEIVREYGINTPMLKPHQIYNTLSQLIEASGLPSAEPYFTEPKEGEIEQMQEEKDSQPTPDQIKLENDIQLENAKTQGKMAIENQKTQASLQLEQGRVAMAAQKEQAQMHADLEVNRQELQADTEQRAQQIQADELRDRRKLEFEREKLDAQIAMHREKMELQTDLHILKQPTLPIGQV